ncbi:MAG TPA: hypothetical protein VH186_06415 [Chloroflexia bacterium]|nr:hypothetical protein [Chloroflexia bacterium]
MYFVWYDDNPGKTVGAKIDEAILRFKERYGRTPDICMLNETIQPADYVTTLAARGVRVMAARNVPRDYFWVGVDA